MCILADWLKTMQSLECQQAIGAQPPLLSTLLLHGGVMREVSAKIFICIAGQYAVMFPKGDKPPLDSITSLLQMLLLLLNRLGCLHAEIQSIWHGTVKNKKDLSRRVQPADRFGAQSMLKSESDKVKAAWDGCHSRIKQVKTHMGMCQHSLAPHVECQFVYCFTNGWCLLSFPNAAGCTFASCTLPCDADADASIDMFVLANGSTLTWSHYG